MSICAKLFLGDSPDLEAVACYVIFALMYAVFQSAHLFSCKPLFENKKILPESISEQT